jgi:hypothetical protein
MSTVARNERSGEILYEEHYGKISPLQNLPLKIIRANFSGRNDTAQILNLSQVLL